MSAGKAQPQSDGTDPCVRRSQDLSLSVNICKFLCAGSRCGDPIEDDGVIRLGGELLQLCFKTTTPYSVNDHEIDSPRGTLRYF